MLPPATKAIPTDNIIRETIPQLAQNLNKRIVFLSPTHLVLRCLLFFQSCLSLFDQGLLVERTVIVVVAVFSNHKSQFPTAFKQLCAILKNFAARWVFEHAH